MSVPRLISIDVGGTFTDVLNVGADGSVRGFKLPSQEPDGLATVFADTVGQLGSGDEVLYSTTVALNSLLAGELPRSGLVVTVGFRDILETARLPASAGQTPPSQLPRRLVDLEWVREVGGRLDANGAERAPVDRAQVVDIAQEYATAGVGVVAVSLLHSYINPTHEQTIARIFREVAPEIAVVLSSTVLRELREYERTLATALNACLIPVLGQHLDQLRKSTDSASTPIWLMQSNGGLIAAETARRQPLTTALSGPGAAVVGMRWLGEQSGFDDLITLDVGGTSTDVALIKAGRYALTNAGTVAGFPLKTPMVDVLSIGAGGGSIAHEAADRRWHVGPESAGARPGPACYGLGGDAPTLTDAQLVLGRLPDALLGGTVVLDRERATAALDVFGRSRGLDAVRTARGILEIATHNMCGAIRRVSVSRGQAPAAYALLAMGGAGPLHAAELAELLGMKTVIVPPQPGLAAAWGLAVADVQRDFVAPVGLADEALDISRIETMFADLAAQASVWFATEGIAASATELIRKLDLRYAGMTHETTVECAPGARIGQVIVATFERFHEHFEQLAGRSWRGQEAVEIVNLRMTATGRRPKPKLPLPELRDAVECAPRTMRAVGFMGHADMISSATIDRHTLEPGARLFGPAVIEQYESTTVLPPAWQASVDDLGNLILESQGGR